jgi:hypothetical protein
MSNRIVQSIIAKFLIANLVCFMGLASAILLHFEINKSYYANNECVFAQDADNTCQGSCCLASLMEPVQDNEQSPSTRSFTEIDVTWNVPEPTTSITELKIPLCHSSGYLLISLQSFKASPFLPPESLS